MSAKRACLFGVTIEKTVTESTATQYSVVSFFFFYGSYIILFIYFLLYNIVLVLPYFQLIFCWIMRMSLLSAEMYR